MRFVIGMSFYLVLAGCASAPDINGMIQEKKKCAAGTRLLQGKCVARRNASPPPDAERPPEQPL
jgi:uncharacterized lipoprotein YbaY